MARRGNPQEAAAAAEKLSALEFADGRELFSAAAAFALCAEGARAAQTSATASANSQSLEEHYAARAVELLRKAEPLGYFKDPIHRALLEADQKLDVLRPRDDFNKLLRTVYEEEPR
jgi:hypothetical protein